MIKTLHAYLVKNFLGTLGLALLAWIVIFVVLNMVENLSKFIDNGASMGQFLLYYLYLVPYVISLTLPIAMLIAALFSVSQLSNHNEIIAQLTAGISLYKILAPLFVTGLLISVISGFFNEYVVPISNQKRFDIERYEIRHEPKNIGYSQNNIYVQDTDDRKLAIKYFNTGKKTGHNISFLKYRGSSLSGRIDAARMVWDDSTWRLKDVRVRRFSQMGETIRHLKDTVITNSRITPSDLARIQKRPEEMSYKELGTFIQNLKTIGADPQKWEVERDLKLAMPFANFIVILIGAPFASRKRRGGTGLSFGISLAISFIFLVVVRVGQVLGQQGTLDPLLGAWLGNILFLAFGIYTLLTVQK